MTTPTNDQFERGNDEINLNDIQDVGDNNEIAEVTRSLIDDPDTTAILSGEGEGTPLMEAATHVQMQFERLSGPTHKPETANSSQAGTCTAF